MCFCVMETFILYVCVSDCETILLDAFFLSRPPLFL